MLNKEMISINAAAAFGSGALMYIDTALSKFGLKAILDNDKHFIEPEPGRFARQIVHTVVQMANTLNIHMTSPVDVYDVIKSIHEKFSITDAEEKLVSESLFGRNYLSDDEVTAVVDKWLSYIEDGVSSKPRKPFYMYTGPDGGPMTIGAALDVWGWGTVLLNDTCVVDANSPSGGEGGWKVIVIRLIDRLVRATRAEDTDARLGLKSAWINVIRAVSEVTGEDTETLQFKFSNLLDIETELSDAELDDLVGRFLKNVGVLKYFTESSASTLSDVSMVLTNEYRGRRNRLVDLLILRDGEVADEVMENYGHDLLDEYVQLYGVLQVAKIAASIQVSLWTPPAKHPVQYKGLIAPDSVELMEALRSKREELVDAAIIQRCVAFSYAIHVTKSLSRNPSTSVGKLMQVIDTMLDVQKPRSDRDRSNWSDRGSRGRRY